METLNKSMEDLDRYARGEVNGVSIEEINLKGGNKLSEIRLSVMGRNDWLERLDGDITVERVNASLGEGYSDYLLVTEEDPKDYVFKLSEDYPKLEFMYNFSVKDVR